ncbi:Fc.00g002860.m01.CDS01 [Cosmosporella sp. VM-42]
MSTHQDSREYWKRDCTGHTWGFIAANVDDPPHCISKCRERFLRELLPKDETFERVCEVLADKDYMDKEQPFRALYCCDSQLCGVDNLEGGGKDPNVNWFINACQDIGYHSIVDPGPPKPTYSCTFDSIYNDDPRCQKNKPVVATKTAATTEMLPSEILPSTSDAFVAEKLTTDPTTLVFASSTSTPPRGSMPAETYSKITDPSLAASLDPSDADEEQDNGNRFSTGVKVTIGLCVVLGLVAILALVFCLLRRRSRRRGGSVFHRYIKHQTSPPPAGSPTPLVSPTISHTDADGVPLTPPARLRERRFLPTVMNQKQSQRESQQNHAGFPASPLYSPSTTKLVPRNERIPRVYGGGNSRPLSQIAVTAPGGGLNRDGSMSSYASDPVTVPSTNSASEPPIGYSDGSPTRPARPQEKHMKITGLVSPGPPPTRALPSTPPSGPISPTMPAPSMSRPGDFGVAIGTIPRNPAQGVVLPKESRDLCDLTEEYARDSRHSWGSWGGSGGGGPGVSVSSPRKRAVNSPVMEETDLERLAGRY